MRAGAKQLDTHALPLPVRYSVCGRLCRPWLTDRGEPEVKDYLLLLNEGILVDKAILTAIARVARSHGFPRLRVTVEVLEDAAD